MSNRNRARSHLTAGRSATLIATLATLIPLLVLTACSGGGKGTTGGWSPPAPVAAGFRLTEVSCPSSSFCLGIGALENGSPAYTVWNGSVWSRPQRASHPGLAREILTCASSTFCLATDAFQTWRWDGRSWNIAPSPGAVAHGFRSTLDMSCAPSTRFCMALTAQGTGGAAAYTFDGRNWSGPLALPALPEGASFLGSQPAPDKLSCASASSCMAVDGDGFAFGWDGSRWGAPVDVLPAGNVTVSCPAPRWCMVANRRSYTAIWDGSWRGPSFVDPEAMKISQPAGETSPVSWGQGDFGVLGLACASPKMCAEIDDAGYAVTFDGFHWSAPSHIAQPSDNLETVGCGLGICVALVDDGLPTLYRPTR